MMRLLFLAIPLLTMSCTELTGPGDDLTNERSSSSDVTASTYVVMPEQKCSEEYSTGTLLRSEILHPSAKICHYSW
jgi:hypothetical protein